MSAIHQNLASGRWFEMTLSEQLGNVGSEIGRATSALSYGLEERKEKALVRALELLDLTLSDKRWNRAGRLREIARAREVCVDTFYGQQEYRTTPKDLENYFYHFALAARQRVNEV